MQECCFHLALAGWGTQGLEASGEFSGTELFGCKVACRTLLWQMMVLRVGAGYLPLSRPLSLYLLPPSTCVTWQGLHL